MCNRTEKKVVYICSPYRPQSTGHDGDIELADNIHTAEAMMEKALREGHAPIVPHLLYPRVLDDDDATAREIGIRAGVLLISVVDEVWAFTGSGISSGMKTELAQAAILSVPVVTIYSLDSEQGE